MTIQTPWILLFNWTFLNSISEELAWYLIVRLQTRFTLQSCCHLNWIMGWCHPRISIFWIWLWLFQNTFGLDSWSTFISVLLSAICDSVYRIVLDTISTQFNHWWLSLWWLVDSTFWPDYTPLTLTLISFSLLQLSGSLRSLSF